MRIEDILTFKGRDVVTIPQSRTVAEALRLLVRHGIGSLVIVEEGKVAGILTERDVLRVADRKPAALATTRVGSVMTRTPLVVDPEDDVHHVMDTMTRNRVRHLPVVQKGALSGMVSIGDVVNALLRDAESENRHLREYVQGMVR